MFKKGKEKETVICCYNPHMNWSISALPDSMWDRLQLTHDIHFLLAIITRGWCEVKPKPIENEHIIKKIKTQDTWHVWSWFVLLFGLWQSEWISCFTSSGTLHHCLSMHHHAGFLLHMSVNIYTGYVSSYAVEIFTGSTCWTWPTTDPVENLPKHDVHPNRPEHTPNPISKKIMCCHGGKEQEPLRY